MLDGAVEETVLEGPVGELPGELALVVGILEPGLQTYCQMGLCVLFVMTTYRHCE